MPDMKKLLHTFDEADEILNDKIDRTNLSTIVASATASVENKKTVLIRGTGRNIESLKVGGRTVQDGVPTPDAPVEVKGVGDKSKNLSNLNNKAETTVNGIKSSIINNRLIISGVSTGSGDALCMLETPFTFKSGEAVTISIKGVTASGSVAVFIHDKTTNSYPAYGTNTSLINTLTSDGNYTIDAVLLRFANGSTASATNATVMIERGSNATDYTPAGKYKIPVLCNGETTNIYLDAPLFDGEVADLVSGKVEKKWGMVVFDGSENWITGTTQGFTYFGLPKTGTAIANAKNNTVAYSDYQVGVSTANIAENIYVNSGGYLILLTQKLGTTVDAFKTWLSTHNMTVVYELDSAATDSFDGAVIPTTAAEQEVNINTELVPSSIEAVTFGDYYTKSEVDMMVNDLQPMFYSSLDTNKVRVTFDSFPTDRIYLINIRFTVDGNTFVCNLSSPRNSVNSQYFTTFTRYGGKNHTVTGYLNLALENKEVIATLLNVELDGESIANPNITRLILSCIK